MNLRLRSFLEYLHTALPAPPARVLEIGCAGGELALALVAAGYDVTGIDPDAPDRPRFHRVRLEEYTAEPAAFDAVVASLALHHVPDLGAAVAKIAELLPPSGRLVLAEFAKERIAGNTARWYHAQRLALAAVGREDSTAHADFHSWHEAWVRDRGDVHPSTELVPALAARFRELHFERTPYLFSYRLDDALEPAERALIESAEIDPVGYRYVGEPR